MWGLVAEKKPGGWNLTPCWRHAVHRSPVRHAWSEVDSWDLYMKCWSYCSQWRFQQGQDFIYIFGSGGWVVVDQSLINIWLAAEENLQSNAWVGARDNVIGYETHSSLSGIETFLLRSCWLGHWKHCFVWPQTVTLSLPCSIQESPLCWVVIGCFVMEETSFGISVSNSLVWGVLNLRNSHVIHDISVLLCLGPHFGVKVHCNLLFLHYYCREFCTSEIEKCGTEITEAFFTPVFQSHFYDDKHLAFPVVEPQSSEATGLSRLAHTLRQVKQSHLSMAVILSETAPTPWSVLRSFKGCCEGAT